MVTFGRSAAFQAGVTLRDVRLVPAAEECLDEVHDAAAQARTAARAAIEVADVADAAVLAAVEAMVTVEDATDKVTAAAARVRCVSEPV